MLLFFLPYIQIMPPRTRGNPISQQAVLAPAAFDIDNFINAMEG